MRILTGRWAEPGRYYPDARTPRDSCNSSGVFGVLWRNERTKPPMKVLSFPDLGKLTVVSCLAAAIAATNVYAMGDVPVASIDNPQPIYQPSPKYSLAMRYDQ